jgi:AraC-like DNA-binding protein
VVPWVMVMPVGPLIYFYIRSCLEPDLKLSIRDMRQFYPVFLEILPRVAALVFLILVAFGFPKTAGPALNDFIDEYNVYVDIPRWLLVSCYILVSYQYLNKPATKKRVEMNGNLSDYTWLRQFIHFFMGFQVIWLFHLVPYIIPATRDKLLDAVDWYPVYLPLTVLIYVLGIRGYVQLRKIALPPGKGKKPPLLSRELITGVIKTLNQAMEEEKLYLDPALDLSALSKNTGITPKIISAVLNQHLHKSFNEFINGYRVSEIKKRLLEPQSKNLTIAGLAYDCGFNSLPTFQRAFKAVEGITPTEFITESLKHQ